MEETDCALVDCGDDDVDADDVSDELGLGPHFSANSCSFVKTLAHLFVIKVSHFRDIFYKYITVS